MVIKNVFLNFEVFLVKSTHILAELQLWKKYGCMNLNKFYVVAYS